MARRGTAGRALSVLLLLNVLAIACGLAACSSPEERAQNYYESGAALLKKGDYARAAIEFKNALQIKNDMVPAWKGLLQIAEQNQQWPDADKILRKLIELEPKDVNLRLRLARLILLRGDYEQVLKIIAEAESINPKHSGVLSVKALALFKLNERGSAVTEAQKALAIDPLNSEATLVVAAYRFGQGDAAGALMILDKNAEKRPRDLGIQLFKLMIFDRTGDKEKTEAHLQQLIKDYPKEVGFRKQLAKFYLAQKQPDKAEQTIRAIADANPNDTTARLDFVRYLLAVKGADAAREELNKSIKQGGENFPYELALAELEYAQGRAEVSMAMLTKLSQTAKDEKNVVAAKTTLAQYRLDQKDYAAAKALIVDILKNDPRNVDGLRLRATLQLAEGNVEQAISDLRQAMNEQPESPALYRLLALAYERSGSIELADDAFGKAVKAAQFGQPLSLEYAAFLQRRGKLERAEGVLIETSNRAPKDVRVLSSLAQLKLARGDWAGAQQVGEALREASMNDSLANQIIGEALAGEQKYDLSIGMLEKAHEATPDAMQPMASLVRAFLRAEQPEKAEEFVRSVIEANPDSAEAYILLGTLQQNGDPTKAEASFKTAIAKRPDEASGYVALSDFYTGQRKFKDSMEALKLGLEKKPDSFPLLAAKAGVEQLQGNYEAAIGQYEALLKKEPGSLVIINNLASLLSDHRTDQASLDRAHALALTLTQIDVAQFKDTLGWIKYRRGELQEAKALLEEAHQALPNMALVSYHLGMTYLASGETEKAAQYLKKALEQLPMSGGVAEDEVKAALKKAGVS